MRILDSLPPPLSPVPWPGPCMQVQCATKVGRSSAWLASGDNSSAHISIVECVTPSPIMLECFKVSTHNIHFSMFLPLLLLLLLLLPLLLLLLVFVCFLLLGFFLPFFSSDVCHCVISVLFLPLFSPPFQVNSMRILDILYVPPSSFCLAESEYAQDTITMQQQRRLSKGSVQGAATLTVIPSYLATVWMGAQCGK